MSQKILSYKKTILSMVIAQSVAFGIGYSGVAVGSTTCSTVVSPNVVETIDQNVDGGICQDVSGEVDVTIASGVTIKDENYGLVVEGGVVNIGENVDILISNTSDANDEHSAVVMESQIGQQSSSLNLNGSAIDISVDSTTSDVKAIVNLMQSNTNDLFDVNSTSTLSNVEVTLNQKSTDKLEFLGLEQDARNRVKPDGSGFNASSEISIESSKFQVNTTTSLDNDTTYNSTFLIYNTSNSDGGNASSVLEIEDSQFDISAAGYETDLYISDNEAYADSDSDASNAVSTVNVADSVFNLNADANVYGTSYGFLVSSRADGDMDTVNSESTFTFQNSELNSVSSAIDASYAIGARVLARGYNVYAVIDVVDSQLLSLASAENNATATGILSQTQVLESGAYTTIQNYFEGSEIISKAEISNESGYSEALGVEVIYGKGDSEVELVMIDTDVTSISSRGVSSSVGINIFNGSFQDYATSSSIEIEGSTIEAIASGSTSTEAIGLNLQSTQAEIALTDSSIHVQGDALSADAESQTIAVGMNIRGEYDGSSPQISLRNSDIVVSSNVGNSAFGITIQAEDATDLSPNAQITLDEYSSITAEIAIEDFGFGTSLLNAGQITGQVYVNDIVNSGWMDGSITTDTIVNTGQITGVVNARNFENHGVVNGLVIAQNAEVLDTGVIAGGTDVDQLTVRSGGELQALMTDITDPEVATFRANTINLEDGSKIHINATSRLFNAELEGEDYLIVQADSALSANQGSLSLLSSGLVSVQWADCDSLALCVNVKANDLAELSQSSGASLNAIQAARAAQSVLSLHGGTNTGDEFMEIFNRIADDGNWEEVVGNSAQGEANAATNASERLAARYIQNMLHSGLTTGLSSGEEYQAERGLWIQALQVSGDADNSNRIAGFDIDTTAMSIGYTADLKPGLLVGAAFTYAKSNVDSNNNNNEAESDNHMATLYTQWTQGEWFANGMFTYGRGNNEGKRTLAGDLITSDYDSDVLSFRFQGGRSYIADSGLTLSPRFEFNYVHSDIDSYDEKGSVAALSVDNQSYETIEVGAGVELSKSFIFDRSVLTPYADIAVYHDFSQDQVKTSNQYIIGGDTFVTRGHDVAETNVSASVGVNYDLTGTSSVRATYEFLGSEEYKSSTWMLRYSYSF